MKSPNIKINIWFLQTYRKYELLTLLTTIDHLQNLLPDICEWYFI